MSKTMPLFPVQSEWVAPQSFPNIFDAAEIAIDLETRDPNMETFGPGWPRKDGEIVGYAVAVEGWKGYFPVGHQGGGNLDRGLVERWMRDVCKAPGSKVMHNAAYDLGWLLATGYEVNGKIFDTMIAAPLLDENRFSYSLNALGFDYLQEVKSEQGLKQAAADFGVHPKKELWKLPAMYVGDYAEQDAALTLKLWQRFKGLMRNDEVEHIFGIESELLPILVDMTLKGVPFDRMKCERLIGELEQKEKQLHKRIREAAGMPVDIWAAVSIAEAFDRNNVPYYKTDKGAPSFTKNFMLNCDHEIGQLIVEAREVSKAHGTFLHPYMAASEATGRIHPHINQLRSDDGGTVSGRLCVHGDTLLHTSAGTFPIRGYVPSGEDLILTHRGRYRKILRKFMKGTEKMYTVSLVNGSEITCTGGHRVLTPAGWKHVRDLCVGEEIFSHVDIKASPTGHGPCGKSSAGIPIGQEACPAGARSGVLHRVSHRSGDGSTNPDQGAPSPRAAPSLFPQQDRREESDEGENGGSASQLQGPCGGLKGISHGPEAHMVHLASGVEACVSASRDLLPSERDHRHSEGLHHPPHRRGQEEQQYRQSCVGDDERSCPYPSSAVCSIHPVGEALVWDIEVEEDHSYVAGGIVHHNSMASPNLQQVPARHPVIGPMIRGLFLPEHGQLWASNDFSSQEPRLLLHYASLLRLDGAQELVDAYNNDPDTDFHQMVADLAGVTRKHAKTIGLGLMYGMGKSKLAGELGLDFEEADALIDRFHQQVPFLKGTVNAVMKRVDNPSSGGAIRTLLGRKCRFPLWEPRAFGLHKPLPRDQALAEYGTQIKRAWTYKALNRLIQGSAADQTKAGMVAVHKAGFRLMLQVHDELVLSVDKKEDALEASEIMKNAVELVVPSKVDVEVGPNWGESM